MENIEAQKLEALKVLNQYFPPNQFEPAILDDILSAMVDYRLSQQGVDLLIPVISNN
jgi:hypothetical protein